MDTGCGGGMGIVIESDERHDHLQQSKLAKFPSLSNLNLLFGNSQTSSTASKCQTLIASIWTVLLLLLLLLLLLGLLLQE